MEESKRKIHFNDIIDGKETREHDTYTADGVRYWADRINKDQLATHADCKDCGVEFEKNYTFDKYCPTCERKRYDEEFNKMEVVEWDGESGLCIYNTDTYFFDLDDILLYAQEKEVSPSELMLVLCTQTTFSTIDICDHVQDDVHEDWEPSVELIRLEKALNDYLATADTNTWTASNKRVVISRQ